MMNRGLCMSEKQSSRSSQTQPESRGEIRRRRLIGDSETASEAVVAAVANAENTEVESLPPLGDQLDTEALNRLVGAETQSPAAGLVFTRSEDLVSDVEVTFEYADYDVTISDSYVILE